MAAAPRIPGAETASDPEETEEEKVLFREGRVVNQRASAADAVRPETTRTPETERPGTPRSRRLRAPRYTTHPLS